MRSAFLNEWRVGELLTKYEGLRIRPSLLNCTVIAGRLSFRVVVPGNEIVEDEYDIEIHVSPRFPALPPRVYETSFRIPTNYHKLTENALCLGAPTALRLQLSTSPSLVDFVDKFVVPYLAGFTCFSRTGRVLFGELAHGTEGIRQNLREMFKADASPFPEEFVLLASMKKRTANKQACPCNSGRRLGKCHNRTVNSYRASRGRKWLFHEYRRITKEIGCVLAMPTFRQALTADSITRMTSRAMR